MIPLILLKLFTDSARGVQTFEQHYMMRFSLDMKDCWFCIFGQTQNAKNLYFSIEMILFIFTIEYDLSFTIQVFILYPFFRYNLPFCNPVWYYFCTFNYFICTYIYLPFI